jgi:ribosome-associated protein
MEIHLEGEEFILLQALLKLSGLCDTGGGAKAEILAGKVRVDGVVEIRRGKKIRAGQSVEYAGKKLLVLA